VPETQVQVWSVTGTVESTRSAAGSVTSTTCSRAGPAGVAAASTSRISSFVSGSSWASAAPVVVWNSGSDPSSRGAAGVVVS
jgi:hypothetical protein